MVKVIPAAGHSTWVKHFHFDKQARGFVVRATDVGNVKGGPVVSFAEFGGAERLLMVDVQCFLRDLCAEAVVQPLGRRA